MTILVYIDTIDMIYKYDVMNGLYLDEVKTPTHDIYPYRSEGCTADMKTDTRAILKYIDESGKPVYDMSFVMLSEGESTFIFTLWTIKS